MYPTDFGVMNELIDLIDREHRAQATRCRALGGRAGGECCYRVAVGAFFRFVAGVDYIKRRHSWQTVNVSYILFVTITHVTQPTRGRATNYRGRTDENLRNMR